MNFSDCCVGWFDFRCIYNNERREAHSGGEDCGTDSMTCSCFINVPCPIKPTSTLPLSFGYFQFLVLTISYSEE